MNRRQWLTVAASLAAAGCAGVTAENSGPRVVRIHTKKFEFVPSEIALKLGEPVVLEFVADDIAMGFRSVPLALRAEIVPGRPTRLPFTPQKAGTFAFYCDVFCGDGHEDMDGHFTIIG